jgi:hypothetical protein
MGIAAFLAMSCLAWGLPAAAQASSSPLEVQTEPAEAIPGGAKLKGKLNPGGAPTTYYFIYKQADAIECEDLLAEGCGPETTHGGPLTGDTQQEVSPAEVTGLEPDTAYTYWLIAKNANGTAVGRRLGFTTPPATPSIGSESVSHVTSTDATLEAEIDVEGLQHGADYQFQIVQNPSEYASELICPSTRPQGHEICVGPQSPGVAPIGFVPSDEVGPLKSSEVSLDLAGAGITLKPGTTYHYRVLAARSVQTEDTIQWEGPTVYGADQTFTTPSAGTAPVIDSVSISHLTPTDATLEGQINSEGLSTMYEFQLTYTQCRECEDIVYRIPLPSGLLLGSFQDQSVSVDLNSIGVTLKPGFYGYSLSAASTGGSTEAPGGSFEPPGGVFEPLSTTTSTSSGAGQPAGINTNTGNQPAGSAGSLSSSTLGVQSPGPQVGKTIKREPLTSAQKLAKALKVCAKKPKKQRATCRTQAHRQYGTTGKKASSKGRH